MSGGAVSNGCGYIGMAHMVDLSDGFANYVHIIPAKITIDFANKHLHKLPATCKNVKRVVLPISGPANCVIQSPSAPSLCKNK